MSVGEQMLMKKLSFLNFALASMAMMLCFSCSDDEAGSFSLSESGMKYVNEGIHLKAKDVQESFMLVETDAMWSAIGDDSWVITTPRYGNAQAIQKTLRISAIENKRFGARTSNVVIKSNGKGNSYTIKVYQECPPLMKLPSYEAGEVSVNPLSPSSLSESKDSWIVLNDIESASFTYTKNEAYPARMTSAFEYVANDGYKDFTGSFAFLQPGTPIVKVENLKETYDKNGGTFDINIFTNYDGIVKLMIKNEKGDYITPTTTADKWVQFTKTLSGKEQNDTTLLKNDLITEAELNTPLYIKLGKFTPTTEIQSRTAYIYLQVGDDRKLIGTIKQE